MSFPVAHGLKGAPISACRAYYMRRAQQRPDIARGTLARRPMASSRKRCRFIDDDAQLSGSASEGEDDDDDGAVENEQDRKFVDDSVQPDDDGDGAEPVEKIKIGRRERKMQKNELQHLLEDAGLLTSTVKDHRRKRDAGSSKKIYMDADEEGWNSGDAGFVASDDEVELDSRTAGARAQKLLRDYVRREGLLI